MNYLFIKYCEHLDISCWPSSVNILQSNKNDIRTSEKLIDGINDTLDGSHMWLAPILPSEVLPVFVSFLSYLQTKSICHNKMLNN